MYCPECRCEYVEGIIECVDCHVKLVYELPEEPEETYEEMTYIEDNDADMSYVEMYRDLGAAEIAKDYLEENGIEAVPIVYRFDQITRLYVRKEDAQKAEELLKTFDYTAVEDAREETPHVLKTFDNTAVEGTMEETPHVTEMTVEEPGKTRNWRFLGSFRQYIRTLWLFFGIIWLFWGIHLIITEKSSFHGTVQITIGIFALLIAKSRSSHSDKQD